MKKAEKDRIAEQEEFEKNHITEALSDIRASVKEDATIETHAKAYIAMLRLNERWSTTFVERIFDWLTGKSGLPQSAHGDTLCKRFGKEVFSFLQQQPIPIPTMELTEYQDMWDLYMHPENTCVVCREGQFYVEERSLLVTRVVDDGIFRTVPTEGHWRTLDSYLEALEVKSSFLCKIAEEVNQRMKKVEEEIQNEQRRIRSLIL